VYIESNKFTNTCIPINSSGIPTIGSSCLVQGYEGARLVIRKNDIYMMLIDGHGYDVQVNAPGLRRSVRWYEVYNNTFSSPLNADVYAFMQVRGGSGVVFGNTLANNVQKGAGILQLNDESNMGKTYNTGCSGTWPCPDQIGRGRGNPPTQVGSPLYSWGNTNLITVSGYGLIQPGRDYFDNTQKPGYTPYTFPHPLTGASGAAPATPTNIRIVR